MTAELYDFLSRDELLGGLPARRASTLLFAIESRTAHLVARSRRAMARYLTEKTAEVQEREFLNALAQGRELPVQPTIQDLERYAPHWASLVPDDPAVRAAVARLIGEKYAIPERRVPKLRRALGLHIAEVRSAFERLHSRPIATIYTDRLDWRERLRWIRSDLAFRLESLPPFWTAFALTLTETVGAGILALPIALAQIGPLGGVVILVVLGLINVLTIAAMGEAVARNGNVRYGNAYFGRLVSDYLGRPGLLVLTPALVILNVVVLLVYYVGLSSTLADATSVPAELWVAAMFVVGLIILRRETLDATVASAVVIGAINITLIVSLSLLALLHVEEANLRYSEVPFIDGTPFNGTILGLIFGVVLLAYFGHTSTGNCAAVVLQRDPSGRSFIWGSVAATASAMALYALWVVAVNGAVAPAALAGASGTALAPLADDVGGMVHVLGSIFVVLAMGMASIHFSLGLFNLVRERLPGPRPAGNATFLTSDLGRYLIGVAPVAVVFVVVEWLFLVNRESFAGPLGFLGVITPPILAGILPMLMLVAARRKGDCPVETAWGFLGHPLVVGGIYLIFLTSVLLHGLVIWDRPVERAAAIATTLVMLAVTAMVIKRGSFGRRTVVELRVEREDADETIVNVSANGRPRPTSIALTYADGRSVTHDSVGEMRVTATIRTAVIELPAMMGRELKIWTHQQTREGAWEGLPALVEIRNGATSQMYDLGQMNGQVLLPVVDGAHQLEIRLPSVT